MPGSCCFGSDSFPDRNSLHRCVANDISITHDIRRAGKGTFISGMNDGERPLVPCFAPLSCQLAQSDRMVDLIARIAPSAAKLDDRETECSGIDPCDMAAHSIDRPLNWCPRQVARGFVGEILGAAQQMSHSLKSFGGGAGIERFLKLSARLLAR